MGSCVPNLTVMVFHVKMWYLRSPLSDGCSSRPQDKPGKVEKSSCKQETVYRRSSTESPLRYCYQNTSCCRFVWTDCEALLTVRKSTCLLLRTWHLCLQHLLEEPAREINWTSFGSNIRISNTTSHRKPNKCSLIVQLGCNFSFLLSSPLAS